MRKTLAAYRGNIAALSRRVTELEREVKRGSRSYGEHSKKTVAATSTQAGRKVRFSAERLVAHRKKLELSAADYAKLVGVSSLSIYKWESGKTRPREAQIQALAQVRGLSKSQAQERLAAR